MYKRFISKIAINIDITVPNSDPPPNPQNAGQVDWQKSILNKVYD